MVENCRNHPKLLDIATNFILEVNASGIITYANQRMVSLAEQEVIGLNINTIWSPQTSKILLAEIVKSLKEQKPIVINLEFNHRDGIFYLYPNGEFCAICIDDITERQQLSHSLQKVSQRLEFAEKTAKIGYWELNIAKRKIYWSAEMYRIFDISPHNHFPKPAIIRKIINKADFPTYKQQIHELLRSGTPASGQLRLNRKDGSTIYCIYKASITCDDGQKKIAGTFQDLSAQIATQLALQKAMERAEKLNRDKSYFLAMASHDLRQPMQALNIFIHTLFAEKLNHRQSEILEKIEASANNLKNLLDNLLDISKLDSGGVRAELEVFDIGGLLQNIAAEYHALAHYKSIKFHALLHHGVVQSDPVLVERIIRNLLSNAFKYTNSKIVLGCKRQGKHYRVMILDNGPGIDQKEQEQIFEEFYQSPQQPEHRKQGAGLGLTIVKKIATILGTRIRIDTIPERGTCFSFLIPMYKKKS